MKKLIGTDVGAYSFNVATKKITITGVDPLKLENLLIILNAKKGVMMYNFADTSLNATISNNVITLTGSFSTTGMLNADPLTIYVDVPDDTCDTVAFKLDTIADKIPVGLNVNSINQLRVVSDTSTTLQNLDTNPAYSGYGIASSKMLIDNYYFSRMVEGLERSLIVEV